MALSKAAVSRQASRSRPVIAPVYADDDEPIGVADLRLEEAAESPALPPAPRTGRLTVNGIAVRRLMLEFGKDTVAFYPNDDRSIASVVERFWDQRDSEEDNDKLSRPRAFCRAVIDVNTSKGYLDVTVTWPNLPTITKVVQPHASLNYEV